MSYKGGKLYFLDKQSSVSHAIIFLLYLPIRKDHCKFFLALVFSPAHLSNFFLISPESSVRNQTPCASEYKLKLLLSATIFGSI